MRSFALGSFRGIDLVFLSFLKSISVFSPLMLPQTVELEPFAETFMGTQVQRFRKTGDKYHMGT
jgi:hypothetical protein